MFEYPLAGILHDGKQSHSGWVPSVHESEIFPIPRPIKSILIVEIKTLDAMYPPLQKKVDDLMRAKNFNDRNWMTKYFPGDAHTESAWKKRLNVPLTFLMGK